MKRFTPYILILLLSVSCIDDNVQFDDSNWVSSLTPRYIHIVDTEFSIGAEPDSFDTYVEAVATPWQFSGQASWLTINPQRGKDDAKVTISATENMSGEDLRTSIFYLSSDVSDYNYKTMVSVTQQAASPYLNVSESSLTIAATGESKSINVDKNISYTISKSWYDTWFTVIPSEDSTRLIITAEPNPMAYTRSGRITLNGLRNDVVINITQEAAGMTSTESGPLVVGVKGADYVLRITSDAAWTASTNGSWFTVSPSEGPAGTTEVVLTVSPNNMASTRSGNVDFKIGLKSLLSVDVTQEAAGMTSTEYGPLKVGAKGADYVLKITSDAAWTATTDGSWFTVSPSEGSAGTTEVVLTVSLNNTASTRNGNVDFKIGSNNLFSVKVNQEAAGMTSTEYGPLEVGVKGADYVLRITSDAAWTASTNGSWFTVSPSEGPAGTTEVVLSVSPSNTTSARSGKVDFKIGSKGLFSVNVNQEALCCSVSSESLSMGAVGGRGTITVSSNTEWKIISKPSWITTDVESGFGNGTIDVVASEHTGREARSGIIEVGVEGVTGLVHSVRVSQSQHYFNLSSSPLAMLPSTGGRHKVTIASDDAWKAEEAESWLSLSAVTGKGNIDVTITAVDNPSIKERSGKVLFTPKYASPIEFPVKQAGRYLSVNTTQVMFYWRGGESLPVAVTTDGTFSVTTQCEWLKIEQSEHSFTLMAEEHDAEEARSGVVTVALTGLVDGEAYSIDIPVVQRPNVPIDIITFPEDQNWNIGGNSHASVTIVGYTTDESWDNWGGSSLGLNITVFGKDENWNH